MPDTSHSFATFRPETAPLLDEQEHLQRVPMDGGLYDVAPDVVGLKTQIVNSYFIGLPAARDWVLVDTGMPGQARRFSRPRRNASAPACRRRPSSSRMGTSTTSAASMRC